MAIFVAIGATRPDVSSLKAAGSISSRTVINTSAWRDRRCRQQCDDSERGRDVVQGEDDPEADEFSERDGEPDGVNVVG